MPKKPLTKGTSEQRRSQCQQYNIKYLSHELLEEHPAQLTRYWQLQPCEKEEAHRSADRRLTNEANLTTTNQSRA